MDVGAFVRGRWYIHGHGWFGRIIVNRYSTIFQYDAHFYLFRHLFLQVVVFSKTFCPFCRKTKNLLLDKGIDAKVIELDKVDNGDAIQDALLELSGQRTVPNVFIKGNHLGGNDDTQKAAREGKLEEMLA